jgi:phage baseplate assembly protein W
MATRYFKGFWSGIFSKTRKATLYDVKLVERDLMNHFMTRVGERVMRPDWGCKIWDWLMEPLTPTLRDSIVQEVQRICDAQEGRVVTLGVDVTQTDYGLTVQMSLQYQPENVIQTFAVNFEIRTAAIWDGGQSTN